MSPAAPACGTIAPPAHSLRCAGHGSPEGTLKNSKEAFLDHIWRFGACEFDERRHELKVGGVAVDIEVKPLEVLRQLLAHAGEVVTKDELLEGVWPGTTVVDGSLATAVSKLRKVLGSDDNIIVTLPRVGYRLGVPVTTQQFEAPPVSDLRLEAGAPVPRRPEWRLTRRLDPSASGEVWLAEHPKTRDTRVFKFASDDVRLKGLKREVTLARLLRESFPDRAEFVRVLEWSFEARPYFIESEYAGPDLAQWAEQAGGLAAVPLDARVKIVTDVARAIAAVHEVGILHKDLKPRNILMSGTGNAAQVKVADFGSAALMAPDRLEALGITKLGFTQTTADASVSGTLMYIAPEIFTGQSPTEAADVYALGVMLYQLVVGDLRRPMSPGWENDVADPLLREDIAAAAAGDLSRRLPRAADLVSRLERLEARRTEARASAEARSRQEVEARRRTAARGRLPWIALGLTVAVVIAGVIIGVYRRDATAAPVKSVAVLPFQNVGTDQSVDFLQLAVPDEITTILSETRNLSVRSFSRTRQYVGASIDPQKAGQELKVGHVVTGHYLRTGSNWRITLEATDVATGGIVWRETIDVPADSPVAMHTLLVAKTRSGLAPMLGASAGEGGTLPKNDEAYLLFLKTATVPFDPEPNKAAIRTLERASSLDPTFGPTWVALARRYYVASRYAGEGSGPIDRALDASRRALALDPNDTDAASSFIVVSLEAGQTATARDLAVDLVKRRPDSADAHFALSYVLRFAGHLDDSAEHCNAAFLIDPRRPASRSCAVVFILKGDYARARDFIQLDFGTDWGNALTIHALVRDGRKAEALSVPAPHIPQWNSYDMLLAFLRNQPADQVAALASAVKPSEDPETNYFSAAHLAYAGQNTAALEMLKRAIDGHYCSFPVLDTDPYFASIRLSPEFRALRASAAKCQEDFLRDRSSEPRSQ